MFVFHFYIFSTEFCTELNGANFDLVFQKIKKRNSRKSWEIIENTTESYEILRNCIKSKYILKKSRKSQEILRNPRNFRKSYIHAIFEKNVLEKPQKILGNSRKSQKIN